VDNKLPEWLKKPPIKKKKQVKKLIVSDKQRGAIKIDD
jgi:hypothetical protein